MSFDVDAIRAQFPQLAVQVYEKPLIYFDNAATTLKPQSVINTVSEMYTHEIANIHRGAHYLGSQGTERYEQARKKVAGLIHAKSESEIVFTRGTTESLNLLAATVGADFKPGEEILITEVEHHSNIVPWQQLAKQKNMKLQVLPVLDSGQWDMSKLDQLLNPRTRLVACTHISNITGLIYPVEQMIARAKQVGAVTVLDAAQSVADIPIDVQKLDCDFLAFSGHKMFGPFGVGVLFGKSERLAQLPPYQTGGSMISDVQFEQTAFLPPPFRFEAGTPNVSGVIGLGTAVDFLTELGLDSIHKRKRVLCDQLENQMREIGGIKIYGQGKEKTAVVSFTMENCHAADVAQILDRQGIAIRTGHLCAQPLMKHFGVAGLARASLSVYNTEHEITAFCHGLRKAKELLT